MPLRLAHLASVDGATIEACRRSDRAALEKLLHTAAPALERLIGRLLGPDADLEDVLQDTLESIVCAFPGFRGEAPLHIWLARIAVHRVQDHLRGRSRRRRVVLEVVRAEPTELSPEPERAASGRRLLERVYAHLGALGARKRVAFVLHVIEGRPLEEVAALMGATKAATKSRVFFARRELCARARRDPELLELASSREKEGTR